MPVILYRDPDYAGPSVRLQPGYYSGRDQLQGTTQGSSYGEDLSRETSSIRVDAGYIAVLYAGLSASASGGGARTIVGPSEIPDLNAVGMNDKTSSVQVYMFEEAHSALPRDFGVSLFNSVGTAESRIGGVHIGQGSFDRARLDSDEVKIGSGGVRGLCVGPNTLAILYEGSTFESTMNSVVVPPLTCVGDIEHDLGIERVNSIRVVYTEVPTPGGRTPSVVGPPGVGGYPIPGETSHQVSRQRAESRVRAALGLQGRRDLFPGAERPRRMGPAQGLNTRRGEQPVSPENEDDVSVWESQGILYILMIILVFVVAYWTAVEDTPDTAADAHPPVSNPAVAPGGQK